MRTVIIYGSLLGCSLLGAWLRWTKEPSLVSEDEVVVLYGEADKIEKLHWESEKSDIQIEAQENGSFFRVKYVDKKKKRKADQKPETKECKGSQKIDRQLTNLSPLVAKRKLQSLQPKRRTEVGLDKPTTKLTITRKGQQETIDFSKKQSSSYYVQLPKNGELFLLASSKVSNFEGSLKSLCNYKLWSFDRKELKEISKATLQTPAGKKLEMEQKNWQDQSKAKWINSKKPEEENKQLSNWIARALKELTIRSYVGSDIDQQKLEAKFSLTIEKESKPAETLDILYHPETKEWYGRSDFSKGLVSISKQRVKLLHDDVAALVGAEAQ